MATTILIVGVIVLFFVLAGVYFSVREGGNFKTFDYFFLGAVLIAFALANYLWFVADKRDAGSFVGIWVAGNTALGMYFRSMITRHGVK